MGDVVLVLGLLAVAALFVGGVYLVRRIGARYPATGDTMLRDSKEGEVVVASGQRHQWRMAIIIALVVLFFMWRAGSFDQVLVNAGLNAKSCLRNAYGATFCGDAAKSYCENLPDQGYDLPMCEQLGVAPLVPPDDSTP